MNILLSIMVSVILAMAIGVFRPGLWPLAIGLLIGEAVGFYLALRMSAGPSDGITRHQNAGLTELLRLRLFGPGERWIRQDEGRLHVEISGLDLQVDATRFEVWEKDPEGIQCCSIEITPSDADARIVETPTNPHNPLAKRITVYMPKDWVQPMSTRIK